MNGKNLEQPSEDRNSLDASTTKPTTLSPAEMSTGPRTATGKAIASRNALKHGIFSKGILLPSESRAQYESLLAGVREYFKREGILEEFLAEKLAVQFWFSRRLIIAETTEIKERKMSSDFDSNSVSKILSRFTGPEASNDRAIERTLTQIERLQRMRKNQPVTPPIKEDISSS